MADMKASVTLELIEKGFDKAEKAAKSLDKLAKSGKKAATTRKGIDWGTDRSARNAERAARAEDRHAQAIHRSTNAMRRQRSEAYALERQQRRLEQAQRRAATRAGVGGGSGHHMVAGAGAGALMSRAGAKAGAIGLSFLGGMGLGVGAGAGMLAASTVKGAASDEWERDQLRVLGEISEAQMNIHRKALDHAGARRGVGTQGAYGVFGGLMAGGLSDADAAAMTDSVLVFAKATQASTEDASRATVALRNNMGITADKLMAAYDAIALGGKAGEFEVEDMAKSLPSLLAKMQKYGEAGETGVRNTVAMAQSIRKVVGSSDEAATYFENMLNDFTASDFVKRASKMGIDVEKTMKQAKDKGLSPVFAILQKIDKATKGDPFKVSKLVTNSRSAAAVAAILRDMPEVLALIQQMETSGGTVMNDFAVATDNATEAWKRFSSNISGSVKSVGDGALPMTTKVMNWVSEQMEANRQQRIEQEQRAAQYKEMHERSAYLDEDKRAFVQQARDARLREIIPAGRDFTDPDGKAAAAEAAAMRKAGRPAPGEDAGVPSAPQDPYDLPQHVPAPAGRIDKRAEAAAKDTVGSIERILSGMDTYAAGLEAGNQFAAGLKASAPQAAAAANAVASSVAGHFPQSPAKAGPLRKLPAMGRKISAQLAGGMAHDSPARAASRVAAGIMSQGAAGAQAAPAAGVRSGGGQGVTVHLGGVSITGVSDPQAAADYAGDAIRRKLDGVLGDVGAG
ncbi:phage tail tape measure protein [Aquamicrobium sp.]|uniref:phage tail tape measure protein n=1 Tax=Aquamicrobium sp. TaxID=1872579 RepID=UPI00258A9258|nr:phage tail tape measure protein [Aquamicrobium sp.]MCK9549642.1 phage tail tape measure protein [Aquamicrobium sp.]